MKSFLTVGCLFLVAMAVRAEVDLTEELKEHIEPCAVEHNIPPSDIPKFNAPELEGDDRRKVGCLRSCVMNRIGAMQGAEIISDKLIETMKTIYGDGEDEVAKYTQMTTECMEEVKGKTDECEVGYDFSHCIFMKRN